MMSADASSQEVVLRRQRLRPSDLVLLRALVGLRWVGLGATVVVLVVSADQIERPVVAYGVAGAALAWTAAVTLVIRRGPELLIGWSAVVIEVAIAGALQAGDGWAFGAEATWGTPALGALWSLAAPMAAGLAKGPRAGGGVAVAVVGARLLGALAPDIGGLFPTLDEIYPDLAPRLIPTLSLGLLYVMAGVGTAYLADRQRRAEAEVATARAREALAQDLHDGVLQTLVAIGRRSEDPTAAHLARETERDLRRYLFARPTTDRRPLDEALADAAREFARRFDLTPEVVVDPETSPLDANKTAAIAGAVTEALSNVGKHASASRVVVYAGPSHDGDGVFVSVKDDGVGFDPEVATPGQGLEGSIRSRVAEAGGRVELCSRPGQGSEVRLWLS
ncbi:MAG TPA: ATP-binding protein [Acidimicrobiales bacterium]|nr:ATP-binding protein [Acidimicrobiales bacterium]